MFLPVKEWSIVIHKMVLRLLWWATYLLPQSHFPQHPADESKSGNVEGGHRSTGMLKNHPGISVVVMHQFKMHRHQPGESPECLVKSLPCVCWELAGHRLVPSQCPAGFRSHWLIIRRQSPGVQLTFFSSGGGQVGTWWASGVFYLIIQGIYKGKGWETVIIIIIIRQWWQFLVRNFILYSYVYSLNGFSSNTATLLQLWQWKKRSRLGGNNFRAS